MEGGGRGNESGCLLTFSALRMGAYSRWALIRGWALIRINTVVYYGYRSLNSEAWFSLEDKHKHMDIRTCRMEYLTQSSIPALLNPMINKMPDEASAMLLLICSYQVWVKVTYDWSTALCLCLCFCLPRFHLLTHVLVLMLMR